MPRDEELRQRHQGVEQRTDAQHDQQDLDDLAPRRVVGLRCEPIVATVSSAHRNAVPGADVLGDSVADGPSAEQRRAAR